MIIADMPKGDCVVTPKPEPIQLETLYKMAGKPVWVTGDYVDSSWRVIAEIRIRKGAVGVQFTDKDDFWYDVSRLSIYAEEIPEEIQNEIDADEVADIVKNVLKKRYSI